MCLKAKVGDMIEGNEWVWPIEWDDKFKEVTNVPVPNLRPDIEDKTVLIDKRGKEKRFIFLIVRNGGQFEYWKAELEVVLIMCGDMFKKILSQGEALKIVSYMEIVFCCRGGVRWCDGGVVMMLLVRWCGGGAWQCGGCWWQGDDGVVGVMIAVVVKDGDDGVGWWWPRGGGAVYWC
ncbi:hypothetical protein Tco_0366205 [Tanacetum coccineum]